MNRRLFEIGETDIMAASVIFGYGLPRQILRCGAIEVSGNLDTTRSHIQFRLQSMCIQSLDRVADR
jgi:hypothetical protein